MSRGNQSLSIPHSEVQREGAPVISTPGTEDLGRECAPVISAPGTEGGCPCN